MHVPSIDVYATYRCGMRCRHCFVGDLLDTSADFDWPLLDGLIGRAAHLWGTSELVYLGGEPTLYPHLPQALRASQQAGYRVKIVSNGGRSLQAILRQDDLGPLSIAVSLDGSSDQAHDSIRRTGAFKQALAALREAHRRGHTVTAIVSVGSHNLPDAPRTLELLGTLGLESISVHYVSNRGFADRSLPVGVARWLAFREQVTDLRLPTPLRFEETFTERHRPLRCAVKDDSMLMFFPDRRVFQCSMYLGEPDGHGFRWDGVDLTPNPAFLDRHRRYLSGDSHCPAMIRINPDLCRQADRHARKVGCIFDKEEIPVGGAPPRRSSHETENNGNSRTS